MSTAPFKEDALNRFRVTHSDRDLKPLIRRLHRLPLLAASSSTGGEDVELEKELIKMELLKWRAGVERVIGSISNLERQTRVYRRQAEETAEQTEQLRQTLAKEIEELERKRKWREHQVRCDEIARQISARGKSRAQLDEQITNLQTSLEEHRSSHAVYLQTTQSRIDTFTQITRLIEECRSLKLPVDPNAAATPNTNTNTVEDEGKMDLDPSAAPAISVTASASSSRLSASAVPFQPGHSGSATGPAPAPAATTSSPGTSAGGGGRSSAPPSQASSSKLKVPTSGHLLPSRPAANRSSGSTGTTTLGGGVKLTRQGSAGLPNRPSNLRSSTTPATVSHGAGTGSLEDGEVGPEEGEVADENRKRGRGSESSGRNTRSRAK
ncbi:hypothetical protein I317_06779 [Kwoniella heveanensis CBS 569]|nr:hypothetical protein I317_06779 [Kwoniella heveanensis CBS 569]